MEWLDGKFVNWQLFQMRVGFVTVHLPNLVIAKLSSVLQVNEDYN